MYKPVPERIVLCVLCKVAFTTTSANKRFCQDAHRLEFRRQINELGRCPHCQRELLQA